DEAYTSGSAIRTAGSIDFMKRFDRAVRGDTDLASTLIAQQGADEEGVLLASIEAAPDELVAREWSSLLRSTRDGDAPLAAVYETYRSARAAAEGADPGSAEQEALQEARA